MQRLAWEKGAGLQPFVMLLLILIDGESCNKVNYKASSIRAETRLRKRRRAPALFRVITNFCSSEIIL